jgi:hypothetical protein
MPVAYRRDRMTNVRPDRAPLGPCPTCHGARCVLPLPNGWAVSARIVIPHPRAWRHHEVAPCPACGGSGVETDRRPRQAAMAVLS